jgi:SAM-dependent methyltransferase
MRHINQRVCGKPIEGVCAGLEEKMRPLVVPGARGVSVGCGNGAKEIRLAKLGIVHEFDLFEISESRVAQGRQLASRHGVGDRVRFYLENPFDRVVRATYDVVYWNNALHHMFDTTAAVEWSRSALRAGGLFVMDDFVGPSRFQWTDRNLYFASAVRAGLPQRLLVHPTNRSETLRSMIVRPDPNALAAIDPTEAADSSNILPALGKCFPDAEVILTGGCIYHLALNDVLANVEEGDAALLQNLLLLDEALAEAGETHYAVALARV